MRIEDLTIFLNAVDKTKGPFASMTKGLNAIKSVARLTALGVAGIGGAAVSVVATFKTFQGTIDGLAKSADKLGIATEKLQAIRQAAEFAGIRTADLDVALQRMSRRLSEVATSGGGTAASALTRLGLDAKELVKLPIEDQLKKVLTGLEGIGNQNEKIALAFKFFDSGGVNLVRLTADAIAETAKEMDALGLSISRIDAAKIEMGNDQLERMRLIIEGFKQRIAVNLATPISAVINMLIAMRKEQVANGDEFETTASRISKAFEVVVYGVGVIRNAVNALKLLTTGVAGAVFAVNEAVAKGIQSILSKIPFIPESWKSAVNQMAIDAEAFTDVAQIQTQELFDEFRWPADLVAEYRKNVNELNSATESLLPSGSGSSGAPATPALNNSQLTAYREFAILQGDAEKEKSEMLKKATAEANKAAQDAARVFQRQASNFEALADKIHTTGLEYESLNLSSIQLARQGLPELETSLLRAISGADINDSQFSRLKEQIQGQVAAIAEGAEVAKAEAIAKANSSSALAADIYGAQGASPQSFVPGAIAETSQTAAVSAQLAAQTAKDAWLTAGSAISTVFDGLKNQIGSYIRITDSMSAAEQKAATVSNKINKKKFEENKLFSRAQAAISAAVGITRALELPFPASLAAAAQVAATAFAQLRAINKTSFGNPSTSAVGGGGASSNPSTSSATGGSAPQQQQQPQRKTTIVLEGRDRNYDADDIQRLVGELKRNGYDIDVLAA